MVGPSAQWARAQDAAASSGSAPCNKLAYMLHSLGSSSLLMTRRQLLCPRSRGLQVSRATVQRSDTDVRCVVGQSRHGRHCIASSYRWRSILVAHSWDQRKRSMPTALSKLASRVTALCGLGMGMVFAHLEGMCMMQDTSDLSHVVSELS